MRVAVCLAFLSLFLVYVACQSSAFTKGVDVAIPTAESDWTCFQQQGITYGIARIFRSTGTVDPNGIHSVANAQAVGFPVANTGIYMFPCAKCSAGADVQVTNAINAMQGVGFGTFWLDIEGGSTYWSTSTSFNQNWISLALSTAQNLLGNSSYNGTTPTLGVYTNLNEWAGIVGSGWSGANSVPLWYAHYDNSPNFNDFQPFGGWSSPAIKQYQGDATICGKDVDVNYYPN